MSSQRLVVPLDTAYVDRIEDVSLRTAVDRSHYRAWPVGCDREASGQAFLAANREQAYATEFRSGGIVISASAANKWELDLFATRYGYADSLGLLPTVHPEAEQERVSYRRGLVREWYVNGPEGLEQSFELDAPGPLRKEPVVVEMRVAGALNPQPDADGVTFVDTLGRRIVRYGGVRAWDSEGKTLASRLVTDGTAVRLVVEAQEARFPVTVDPTFVHEARLLPHVDPIGRAYTWMGQAVAIEGDTAVVGAPGSLAGFGQLGAAYVFVRSGTTWSLQQKLANPDADPNNAANFGWSVSISKDTVVVGAPYDSRTLPWTGAAYVFVRSGTSWTSQQRLLAPDAANGDRFGYSVSVSGDSVVVGADGGVYAQGTAGAAYAFVRNGGVWSLQQKLVARDPASGAWLGNSVSLVGDTVVVGAPRAINDGGVSAGAAYVFVRAGSSWNQEQKLLPTDAADGDYFGSSTSLSADTALVGAPFHDSPVVQDVGSAYVFVRNAGVWTQQQKLVPNDAAALDDFGRQVALVGDTAVVGADLDDGPALTDTGAAFVFSRVASVWTQQQRLSASDGASRDLLGSSVALSAGTLVTGAPGRDAGGAVDSGSAYTFVLAGSVWQEAQKLSAGDEVAGDQLGYSVSVSGDTLVVGALKDDTALGIDTGAVYIFARAGGSWTEQSKVPSPEPVGSFGYAVAANTDTVLVGAPNHANLLGAVYVFARSGTVWSLQQKIVGAAPHGMFGRSVALSGDTAVVGAFDENQVNRDPGVAHVYVRTGNTWTYQQSLSASDRAANDAFGGAVAVDGDTAVVGAARVDLASGEDAGAAYVFTRSGTTWTQQAKLTSSDGAGYDLFGLSVSVAGDSAVVGSPLNFGARGAAYAFVRSGTTWSAQQKLTAPDASSLAQLGYSVSISGDGAVLGAVGDGGKGAAYLFARTGTSWSPAQKLLPPDPGAFGVFGYAVSMSGKTAVAGDFRYSGAAGTETGAVDVFAEGFADLSVSKDDGVTEATAGQTITYRIVAANAGPHAARGARVVDAIPPSLTCVTSCSGTGGATCAGGRVEPSIDDLVYIPARESLTYTSRCRVSAAASGVVVNSVSVTPPSEVTDLNPSDNSSTDQDTVRPGVSIQDTTVTRDAGTAVFGVLLSEPQPLPVSVDFASHDGTGKAGADYSAVAGTLTFPVGQTTSQVSVPLVGSGRGGTRTFFVDLSNPTNIFIGQGSARGLIVDPGSTGFRPLTPCRALDTRDSGLGGPLPLTANESPSFRITGRCGVPLTARSVSLNVTVTSPTSGGHLRIFPAGTALPPGSVINYGAGQTRANSAICDLNGAGELAIYVGQPAGAVHVILDVNGYFE